MQRSQAVSRQGWAFGWILCAVCMAWFVMAASEAQAKSWCAYPLWVHEWGVHVFEGGGEAAPMPWPSFFHARTGAGMGAGMGAGLSAPVRHFPADSGVRALPVLHFYTAGERVPVPLGLEVGITDGQALVWYPQVDSLRTAADANGAWAQEQRAELLAARAKRVPYDLTTMASLGPDPTRQLVWEALSLARAPEHPLGKDPSVGWLETLRAMPGALWVNSPASESERFVFYEGATTSGPQLTVTRGDTWTAAKPHYVLHNPTAFGVHDVFVVERGDDGARVFYAPSIPAGASAGFAWDGAPLTPQALKAETRDRLLTVLTDSKQPQVPEGYDWSAGECVMSRDPALPTEAASGHRLFRPEAEAILTIWGERFFDQPGAVILYREDIGYLDAASPLSIYTDMAHFIDLRRAGLVLWRGLDLAAMTDPSR
jgi:hypothetical protein